MALAVFNSGDAQRLLITTGLQSLFFACYDALFLAELMLPPELLPVCVGRVTLCSKFDLFLVTFSFALRDL